MGRSAIWLACVLGCGLLARAQEPQEADAAREMRLAAMRKVAERFTVKTGEGDKARVAALIEAPLLRFNDPAREFHDATLWAWGEKGRPVCLLAMEQYGDRSWFEYIALSGDKLTAEAKGLKWSPRATDLKLEPFPDAPAPAKQAPRRLAQMKNLLGQLTAHQIGHTGSRYELRLMTTPLYRYASAEEDIQDGAIFAFAYGTNPELLAVVEAQGTEAEAKWQLGFVRCGTAEPHVLLKEKEIFTLPYAKQKGPQDPYWNFSWKLPDEK